MANLAKPRFTTQGLPNNTLAVEQILDSINLESKNISFESTKERWAELTFLYNDVLKQEQLMYKLFNVSGDDALKQIEDKINTANGIDINIIYTQAFKKDLIAYVQSRLGNVIHTEDLIKALNEAQLPEIVGEKAVSNLMNVLNETLPKEFSKFKIPNQNPNTFTGLISRLTYDGNKWALKNDSIHLTTDDKKRIVEGLNIYTKKNTNSSFEYQNSSSVQKEQIIFTILEFLNEKYPQIYSLMSEELNKGNINLYDVNLSQSSILGFIGETCFNAKLRKIFPNDTQNIQIQGTKKMFLQGLDQRVEINIDTILDDIGFQIKNYTLRGGNVQFKGTTSAGYFVDGRARVTNQALNKLLKQLFASYFFNQPFDKDAENEEGEKIFDVQGIQNYESNTYSRFASQSFDDASIIFRRYADNIIHLSEAYSASNNPFGKYDLYVNTIFRINSMLVPSSKIILSIMEELADQTYRSENFDVKISAKRPTQYESSLGYIISNMSPTDHKRGYTRGLGEGLQLTPIANLVPINYTVTLHLDKILQRAVSDIN